jgi:hypothetical protein
MMDPTTGQYDEVLLSKALAFTSGAEEPPPGKVLVWGTEDQIQAMSTRIASGNRVAKNRKMRRKAQANARRRNR